MQGQNSRSASKMTDDKFQAPFTGRDCLFACQDEQNLLIFVDLGLTNITFPGISLEQVSR